MQEILREQLVAPLSYTRLAPPGVGGLEGPGNYWIPVSITENYRFPILDQFSVLQVYENAAGV